jgi:cell division ATPase FtsA
LGAASTKIYVVERGVVRLSHVVNRGSQDITLALSAGLNVSIQEAESSKRNFSTISEGNKANAQEIIGLALDYIFLEANRILLNYQKRYNKNVSLVTLVGGGARLEGITKAATAHFQVEVAQGDPFGKTQAPAFLEDILKHTGPEFAVAIGVALRRLQEFG